MEFNNFIVLFYVTLSIKNKKIIFLHFFIQAIASFSLLIILIINYLIPNIKIYFISQSSEKRKKDMYVIIY